jgi:hypothetical protein
MNSIERYIENLPSLLICSDTKAVPAKSERFLPKRYALDKPYVVVNNPKYNRYITFDVDSGDSLFLWDIIGVPCPTLIVANRDTHSSHYLYELLNPLPERRKWSEKTNRLVESVIKYYCWALGSHKAIIDQIQLTKNAVCSQWETFSAGDKCGQFSVSELAEYNQPLPKIAPRTAEDIGRNCYLFNRGREYAYSIVKDCNSETELYNLLFAFLTHLNLTEIPNQFPGKGSLASGEVKDTAKSIAGWVWYRQSNFQHVKRVGVMGFNPIDEGWSKEDSIAEIKNRQRLSAGYSNQVRKAKTQHAIWSGIQSCRDRGLEITVKNVSELSGVNISTVYRHIDLLE